jgi:hypothetical protein
VRPDPFKEFFQGCMLAIVGQFWLLILNDHPEAPRFHRGEGSGVKYFAL